jgi:hypothetical protein
MLDSHTTGLIQSETSVFYNQFHNALVTGEFLHWNLNSLRRVLHGKVVGSWLEKNININHSFSLKFSKSFIISQMIDHLMMKVCVKIFYVTPTCGRQVIEFQHTLLSTFRKLHDVIVMWPKEHNILNGPILYSAGLKMSTSKNKLVYNCVEVNCVTTNHGITT